MKDQLKVVELQEGHIRIGWFLADEGDFGAFLGANNSSADAETKAAQLAIRGLPEASQPINMKASEWVWDSTTAARRALAAAKLAIKNIEYKMPDWALKALDEGWKPPKGWVSKETK